MHVLNSTHITRHAAAGDLCPARVAVAPSWRASLGVGFAWFLVVALTSLPIAVDDSRHQEGQILKAWRDSLRSHDKDLVARRAALMQLGLNDAPVFVEALLDYIPECELALLPELRRQLAVKREPASLETLRDHGLGSSKASVRRHVALAIGEGLPTHIDWGALLLPLLEDDEPLVRAAAIQALGRLRYQPATELVAAAMRSDFVVIRRSVPAALVRLAGERSVSHIAYGLNDISWRVRSATARALGELHSLAAVKALVARLGGESGRVREDLLTSLQNITGKNFGMNLPAWKRWIEHAPRDFAAPATRLAARESVPTSVVAETVDGAPRYYGVSTLSSKFIFVTDVSLSMGSTAPPDLERGEGAEQTLLEVAQQELQRLISELPRHMQFNLVTFSVQVRSWRTRLVTATPEYKARARQEIDTWSAGAETNFFGALELVFDLAEAELNQKDDASERAPDTVFILTDVEASVGDITGRDLLLDYVAERNRDLDLRLHCVSFAPTAAFLGALAKQTGGTLVTPLDWGDPAPGQ